MEQKITIPNGYTLQKVSDSEYKIVKIGEELPNSWEEFCEKYPLKDGEAWIDYNCAIVCYTEEDMVKRDADVDRNTLPNEEYAEAILALCQLIQLRDCYRQGWKPDWKDNSTFKESIIFKKDNLEMDGYNITGQIFAFQSGEIRDKFYDNFKDLIKKIKPLFM